MNHAAVLKKLAKRFPTPGAMELLDPYRTLVGVVLSARTRDEQVLKLLPSFFSAFPTVQKLANASVTQIQARVNTIGMFRQKSKHLKRLAEKIVSDFGGHIPQTLEELVLLPGVGRKTASVVIVACFGGKAIAVDTHVHRVTNRFGWVKTRTPQKTEAALLTCIPEKMHPTVNRVFVKLGRYVCLPGRPRCWACPVRSDCAFAKKNHVAPVQAPFILDDILRREEEIQKLRDRVKSEV